MSPLPTALSVRGYVPAGVDGAVESVIVLVHVGRHWDGEKEASAPVGRPVALNVTAVDVPEIRVAVTDAVTEPPAVTGPDVGFTLRLKSNGGGARPGTKNGDKPHWHRFIPTWSWPAERFPRGGT